MRISTDLEVVQPCYCQPSLPCSAGHSETLSMGFMRFFPLCGFFALALAQASTSNATAPSPIPIAVGGKDPIIAKLVVQLMLPEYDGTSQRRKSALRLWLISNSCPRRPERSGSSLRAYPSSSWREHHPCIRYWFKLRNTNTSDP